MARPASSQVQRLAVRKEAAIVSEKNEVPPEGRRKRFDAAFVLLVIAVVISGIFTVRLTRENLSLKSVLKRASTGRGLSGPSRIQQGDLVPAFHSTNLAGEPVDFRFTGSDKSLVFIFSFGCDVCTAELPLWNDIAARAGRKHFIVRGFSFDSLEVTRENMKDNRIEFEILIMPSMGIKRAYRVESIPQVMVISETGTVEWFHFGAMSKEKVAELLSTIGADS